MSTAVDPRGTTDLVKRTARRLRTALSCYIFRMYCVIQNVHSYEMVRMPYPKNVRYILSLQNYVCLKYGSVR